MPVAPGRTFAAGRCFHAALLAALLFSADVFAGASGTRDPRPKLVLLLAETEYKTNVTVPAFAKKYLEKDFRIVVVTGSMVKVDHRFDRIEELDDADLRFVSVVRRTPPPGQLNVIRRYVAAGKPLVGIRTTNHAFLLGPGKGESTGTRPSEKGNAHWPDWDVEVIGGNYNRAHVPIVPSIVTAVDPGHPILRGVELTFEHPVSLYKVLPLRPGAHMLLRGTTPSGAEEPVAWTYTHKGGGRVFYTSLGVAANFDQPAFNQLLPNGVLWAAGRLK